MIRDNLFEEHHQLSKQYDKLVEELERTRVLMNSTRNRLKEIELLLKEPSF